MKNTLVIGASTNPDRYSFKAIQSLRNHGHSVVAFGLRNGSVGDTEIVTQWNPNWEIDTVTIYINPKLQVALYTAIVALKPRRVIFNPGTENPAFGALLAENSIAFENACTLVLLSIGEY
jgi:predicted CoA-binding protein